MNCFPHRKGLGGTLSPSEGRGARAHALPVGQGVPPGFIISKREFIDLQFLTPDSQRTVSPVENGRAFVCCLNFKNRQLHRFLNSDGRQRTCSQRQFKNVQLHTFLNNAPIRCTGDRCAQAWVMGQFECRPVSPRPVN